MKNNKFNNKSMSKEVINYGKNFKKGSVSGNSIEFMEGNSFTSICYYNNAEARDEDLKLIEELLANN